MAMKKSQRCVTKCKRGKGGSYCRTAAGNPKRCKSAKSAGGRKKARRGGARRSKTRRSCYGMPSSTRKYSRKVSCRGKKQRVRGHGSCRPGFVTATGDCPKGYVSVKGYSRCKPKKGRPHGSRRPRRLCVKGTRTVRR